MTSKLDVGGNNPRPNFAPTRVCILYMHKPWHKVEEWIISLFNVNILRMKMNVSLTLMYHDLNQFHFKAP